MQTYHDPTLESLSLAFLFPESYIGQQLLAAHHPGQSSYIWSLHTTERSLIVRTSRLANADSDDFSQGSLRLFDSSVREASRMVAINNWFACNTDWSVPRVYGVREHADRTFLLVEKMPGTPLRRFDALEPTSLLWFGTAVAQLHQHRYAYFGSHHVLEDLKSGHPKSQFLSRLVATIQYLIQTYHSEDYAIRNKLPALLTVMRQLPEPRWFSPMMLDMDASQFVAIDGVLQSCVDTEYYVVGPPELELVGLEYLLSKSGAQTFLRGYESVAPMPTLRPYRDIFRLLLRLLSFQGPIPWDVWMNAPIRFVR